MSDETTAGRPERPATPELDRLISVSEESQRLGEFLEWLEHEGAVLCAVAENGYRPQHVNIDTLLARYFKIDLDQVERERLALLDWVREERS